MTPSWVLEAPIPRAASRMEGGTDLSDARLAMMMVGSVIKVSTRPPTRGVRARKAEKIKKDGQSQQAEDDGGNRRQVVDWFTSMRSVHLFLGANSSR